MVSLKADIMPDGDDIVISGISGQFPACLNIDEFRDKLFSKEDLIETRQEHCWKNGELFITVIKIHLLDKWKGRENSPEKIRDLWMKVHTNINTRKLKYFADH